MATNKLKLWNTTYGDYERMVIAENEASARDAAMYQLCINEGIIDVSYDAVDEVKATEITGLTGEQIKYRLYWYMDYGYGGQENLMTIVQYLMQFLPEVNHDT